MLSINFGGKYCLMLRKYWLFLLLLCVGCQRSMPFDKAQWANQTDPAFPPECRKSMLRDLLSKHRFVGSTYADVIKLLGKPDATDSVSISYQIEIKYDMIDPIYVKDLDFFFSKDAVITSLKVYEWKKK